MVGTVYLQPDPSAPKFVKKGDTVEAGDTLLIIDYTDNGNGVTKEQLAKLFDPFFTTKRDQGGSGLGTHITFNLVKQTLSGSIEASSEPGKGLHYHIEFPKNMPKPLFNQ